MRAGLLLAATILTTPTHAGVDQLTLPALVSPRAAHSMLLGIATAGDRLVAVGERGIVVTSDDRGATWKQSPIPLSATLTAVHFPSVTKGWAVGHDGVILHSADGGKTWTKQLDGHRSNAMLLDAATRRARDAKDEAATKAAASALDDAKAAAKFGPSRPLLAVWFRDEKQGFAAGSYGLLLRTQDGGATWSLWSDRIDNPDGYHFNAITATASGALLIAGEAGRVWRSTDGGERWESLSTGYKGQLYGALGLRNEAGGEDILAFGFKGNAFRLAAGSKAWEPVASGTTKTLTAGIVQPNGEPLLVSQDGRLHAGADKGRRFRPGAAVPLLPAAMVATSAGVAVSGLGGVKLIAADAAAGAVKP